MEYFDNTFFNSTSSGRGHHHRLSNDRPSNELHVRNTLGQQQFVQRTYNDRSYAEINAISANISLGATADLIDLKKRSTEPNWNSISRLPKSTSPESKFFPDTQASQTTFNFIGKTVDKDLPAKSNSNNFDYDLNDKTNVRPDNCRSNQLPIDLYAPPVRLSSNRENGEKRWFSSPSTITDRLWHPSTTTIPSMKPDRPLSPSSDITFDWPDKKSADPNPSWSFSEMTMKTPPIKRAHPYRMAFEERRQNCRDNDRWNLSNDTVTQDFANFKIPSIPNTKVYGKDDEGHDRGRTQAPKIVSPKDDVSFRRKSKPDDLLADNGDIDCIRAKNKFSDELHRNWESIEKTFAEKECYFEALANRAAKRFTNVMREYSKVHIPPYHKRP